MFELSGILLCGGRSERMGQDKGLIAWEGEPLVVRLAMLLQGLFQEVLVVTGRERRYTDLLDLPILEDKIKGIGPLGGAYTGLLASKHEYNLVAACDMPRVKPELISLLVSETERSSWIIIPQVRGYLEPLLAIYSKRCLPAIEQLISSKRLKLQGLCELVPTKVIPEEKLRKVDPELESFFNLNAPQDLRLSQARQGL